MVDVDSAAGAASAAGALEPGRLQLGPARLLGIAAWVVCLAVGMVGLVAVPLLVWVGAGLVAGVSLSGSV